MSAGPVGDRPFPRPNRGGKRHAGSRRVSSPGWSRSVNFRDSYVPCGPLGRLDRGATAPLEPGGTLMTRAISLHQVSKSYTRGVRVVERLSLDIRPGEFLVLLGPSGCGKSTVLRMIAGLENATEGEVRLDGEDAGDLPPSERDMAMVFQNFALYPSMTGRDNIGFPLRIETPGEDPRPRVDATARMLGIEDLLDRFPHQLSGGERQRVAMGRAIARHPSAFLMDEPLSNLDAKLRNHLRAEIASLTRGFGVATVYVTHDQAEALSLGDRVAILRGGVPRQRGTPRTVYALPGERLRRRLHRHPPHQSAARPGPGAAGTGR